MSQWSAKGRPWQRTRRRILERDGYRCQVPDPHHCTIVATEVDHIVPKAQGGPDRDDNLRAACSTGNKVRNRRIPPGDSNLTW